MMQDSSSQEIPSAQDQSAVLGFEASPKQIRELAKHASVTAIQRFLALRDDYAQPVEQAILKYADDRDESEMESVAGFVKEIQSRDNRLTEAVQVITELIEQIEAYRSGWLGRDVWRDRIGITQDLENAKEFLKASSQTPNGNEGT